MTLISAPELAARLDNPELARHTVVCDVRFYLADHEQGRREYEASHISGAVFVDLHTQLAGGSGGGRHPLPTVDQFTTLLSSLGISPSTFVVAYDSAGGAIAARLWWMLRSIGHGQVAVLDGGFPAWVAIGGEVDDETPVHAVTNYPAVEGWTGVVDVDGVAESASLGGTIVDSRAGERFRGEVEPIDPKPGHIPGAINHFHGDNLDDSGHHRPLGELAQSWEAIGESPIVYCGSGVTACHNLLVLSLVGVTEARLYPGSWSEWSSDPDRPVATGY